MKRIQGLHRFCGGRAGRRAEGASQPAAVTILCALVFAGLITGKPAGQRLQASTGAAQPIATAPADPAIARALADVSAAHIRQTVSTLVDFHTRNTLSSMDTDLPPNTGVTAAAKWIEQQFTAISDACHGCLEVKTDTFTEPGDAGPRSRVKVPTTITNVYAIMRGSDAAPASCAARGWTCRPHVSGHRPLRFPSH